MLSAIWTGAGNASDIFLLIAAVLAGIEAIVALVSAPRNPIGVLLPAAVCLIALGLMAV